MITIPHAQRDSTDSWLTEKEASFSLAVSRATINAWRLDGLPAEKSDRKGKPFVIHIKLLRGWQKWVKAKRTRKHYWPTTDDSRGGWIYGLVDPRPEKLGQIRYIGKAFSLTDRKRVYRRDRKRGKSHSPSMTRWFSKLAAVGLEAEFRVLERCETGLSAAEIRWIAKGRAEGWSLLNTTNGGECGTWSDEAKARARAKALQLHAEPTYRSKFLAAQNRRFNRAMA